MRTTLVRLALVLLPVFGGCAAPVHYQPKDAPVSVAPAAVQVGDYWEYAVRDAYTGFDRGIHRVQVKSVSDDRWTVDVTRNGEPVDSFVYRTGWNGLEHPLPNIGRFRFDPAFPAYEYPLSPGKSWYRVITAIDPDNGARYRMHTHSRVAGWERIRVPAGEFDALRIERQIFAGNGTGFKSQETIRETDWYVPALGQVARSEASSEHFDDSRSGGDGDGEYPLRIRGDWLVAELVRHSR